MEYQSENVKYVKCTFSGPQPIQSSKEGQGQKLQIMLGRFVLEADIFHCPQYNDSLSIFSKAMFKLCLQERSCDVSKYADQIYIKIKIWLKNCVIAVVWMEKKFHYEGMCLCE